MKSKILILSVLLVPIFIASADVTQKISNAADSAYRFYKEIDNISINVPTVVHVPFENNPAERLDFAVLDKTTKTFEPYYFKKETITNETPLSIITTPGNNNGAKIIDKDAQTHADFPLPESAQGKVLFILSSQTPITSSALTLLLDNNVALPTSIEIRALIDGQNKIVVANQKMDRQTVYFLKTTSSEWQITFNYGQPLRVSELVLIQNEATKSSADAIRFLAQPNHSYRIYFDPDRLAGIPTKEAGNLSSAKEILQIQAGIAQYNPDYTPADIDNDQIRDIHDNCVSVFNPNQEDVDNNGRGDACDDWDMDGVINSIDNCRDYPNKYQEDIDSDGVGDACDNEESRVTERYPWIPWVGIGFAAIVLIVLLVLTARTTHAKEQGDNRDNTLKP